MRAEGTPCTAREGNFGGVQHRQARQHGRHARGKLAEHKTCLAWEAGVWAENRVHCRHAAVALRASAACRKTQSPKSTCQLNECEVVRACSRRCERYTTVPLDDVLPDPRKRQNARIPRSTSDSRLPVPPSPNPSSAMPPKRAKSKRVAKRTRARRARAAKNAVKMRAQKGSTKGKNAAKRPEPRYGNNPNGMFTDTPVRRRQCLLPTRNAQAQAAQHKETGERAGNAC